MARRAARRWGARTAAAQRLTDVRVALFALALIFVSLVLASCDVTARPGSVVVADTTAGEIPFRLAGPGGAALVVPVHINGQGPYDFILDTGATLTCVAEDMARQLELRERPLSVGYGVGIGGGGRVRMLEIDSLRVGPARADGLAACALDLSAMEPTGIRVHGLLGLNFLKAFHVSLDFQRRVMTLQQPS